MTSAGKTVLCINDEASGDARHRLLESCGFNVLAASSGLNALETFKSQPINAVVVDYSDPERDQLIPAHLKQLKPGVPVIVVGGDRSVVDAVSPYVDAFVHGPDESAKLLRKLDSLIRLRSHSHPELEKKFVVFADATRQYLDCSDGVCELLGFPRMELLNMTIDDVSYRSDKTSILFEQYLKQGKMDGQYILKHRSSKPVFIEYQAHVFSDGCIAAVWQPVKDWKQLYQSAMLELEPDRLRELIEVAHASVQERMREMSARNERNSEEWWALEDALSGLRVLSRDVQPRAAAVRPQTGSREQA